VVLSRKLTWIIIIAIALRVIVRWHSGEADFWLNGYSFFFDLAKNIAAGNGIALDGSSGTAFRVPLYPMVLALLTFGHQTFLPVLLAESLIGAATVWCAAMIARELFDNRTAVIAAILTAIYPYYVVHDTALQETSLSTFLAALAVLLLLRVRRSTSIVTATGAGVAIGAAVLTRANLAPFALIAPLWLALAGGSNAAPLRRRLYVALLCASVMVLVVSPWLVRVYRLTGSVTLSTETGFFLWLGNNPYTFSHYPEESIDSTADAALTALSLREKEELDALSSDEAAKDQWFRKKALVYIWEHPWQALGNGFLKVVDAFGFLISPRHSFWPTLAHALSYGPILCLGLWGMWAAWRHWREHSILYAQFGSFAVVTAVFFGATSYRSYLDVYLIVFAAWVLSALQRTYLKNRGSMLDNVPPFDNAAG
jgi:4-amino-4-deoxy-L-arabinose transferase-like glycosyltransferase